MADLLPAIRHRAGRYVETLWRALTDPSPAIQRLEDRRQARFLSALLVLAAPLGPVIALMPTLLSKGEINPEGLSVALLAFFGVIPIYVLSRSRHYHTAAILAVALASAAIFLASAVDSDMSQLEAGYYLVVPILLSSILLSVRATLIIILFQGTGLLLVTLVQGPKGVFVLFDVFMYYLMLSLLIALFTHQRNLLERDRRAEMAAEQHRLEAAYNDLENRIAARTAEFSALNADLLAQIAERERAEEALVEERNLLRTLIENVPDMIFVLDTEGRYILDNAAHRMMLGVQTLDEVVGKGAADFFSPEAAAEFRREEIESMQSGHRLLNLETQYHDPAGQRRWASTSKIPFRDSQGHITGLVGIVHDITELKQAESLLRQAYDLSEQQVSQQNVELSQVYTRLLYQASLLENVSEAVVATNLEGIIQSWNRAAETLYGYSAEEAIGASAWEFFVQGLSEESRQAAEQNLRQRRPWQGEMALQRKDGQRLLFNISVAFVRDHDGSATGIVTVGRDITERKRAEAAERDQRLFAEALRETAAAINSTLELDEVLNGIFLHIARIVPCDTASIVLIENGIGRVARHWGSVDADIAQDLFAIEFPIAETPTLRQMIDTGQPLLINDTHTYPGWVIKRGHNYFASYIGTPIKIQGEVVGFLGANAAETHAFRTEHRDRMVAFAEQVAIALRNAHLYETIRHHAADLTHHVAERTLELERERAQLSTILDSMNEGVISGIYEDEQILRPVYINRALVELTGYGQDEWQQHFWKMLSDTAESQSQFKYAIQSLKRYGYWQGQVPLQRKDGSMMDAEVTCTRISIPNEAYMGLVAVIRDISQEKALQEQRSRFVANASHELRTPLTNLMTRLWLLRKQPERLDEHLVILEEVASRMRHLVEDLLDVSRLERDTIPIDRVEMDLRQTALEVVRLQAAEAELKDVRLACDLPENPLIIRGDARRVHQVITNLVTNAINYTPGGGQVMVSAALEMDSNNHATHVIIRIQDSGIGIPPEHLPHLFHPFYRVGEQGNGTGLGLAIAKEIMRLHGGDITVESEVGQGSCFSVRFALAGALLASHTTPG